MIRLRRLFLASCLLLIAACCVQAAPDAPDVKPKVFQISITSRYNAQARQPQVIRDFLAAHPNVQLVQWDGIKMPAEGARASLAMAMAANIGPDIFETDIRQAVEQRLAYPLTEWIGQDGVLANGKPKLTKDGKPDKNGQIDADESKWPDWMKIKPLYRQVVTVDGIPYALPNRGGTYVGILYSKSLLRKAGLDPMHPPKTYDEFIRWVRLLYDPVKKTFGLELTSQSWAFAPWVATTGSSIVVQDRKDPADGKTYTFNEQDTQFIAPNGHDLQRVVPTWRCNVASPECTAAVAFYHRLRWAPWIMDKQTHEPVELTADEVNNGSVMFRGRRVVFSKDDVVEGSISVTTTDLTETLKRLGRDLAMYPLWSGDMTEFQNLGLQPQDMGMLPFPGMNEKCRPVVQASNSFFMIGKDIQRRGGPTLQDKKAYRDLVWEMMRRVCSPEGADEDIRRKVAAGQARFLNPRDLERLGFTDYLREIPPENMLMWQQIANGQLLEVVEPFMGKWLQFRDFYQREIIDLVLRPSGKEFDYKTALKNLERDANTGIMFERPASVLAQYRPKARLIAILIACLMGFFTILIVRDQMKKVESKAGVYKGWLPWLMLTPAIASIALWGYYPLARGLVMAFQDYKVVGTSPFVGLNNFISIALDPNFYHYLFTTFRFVLWNLGLAFCTPIILAFLLTEVPRFKIFFRTLFFLPQMTSGLVVTLMWKEMYAGTAQGTINRLIMPVLNFWVHLCTGAGLTMDPAKPIDWLGNPHTVMACVIIPSVWAASGIGSLIYLAALKSVPEELYEAANLDGATILGRIRNITLPTILPLVMINFVGAFIGTFQSMGQIFLLTFGGPGKETMVMGMAIWQEAYVNMRFSLATSYAWILGSILIGFTYMQLRILRRVDFRQAKGD